MKILSLLGSPRSKGNTATVLNSVEAGFIDSGHEVFRINIPQKKVNGCLGCNKCRLFSDRPACIQNDDAEEIFFEMMSSDLILLATPVYYWGMTAQLKALVDRTNSLITKYGEPDQTSLLEGKSLAFLATGGGVYENNKLLFDEFDKIAKALFCKNAGQLHIGECLEPENITEEIKNKGYLFSQDMLKMLAK